MRGFTTACIRRSVAGLSVALLACAARPAGAAEFTDAFSAPALGSFWESYHPADGSTLSTSDLPGSLRITIPALQADDLNVQPDLAPQARVPAPPGDWSAEVDLNLPDDPTGDFQAGLAVQFGPNDYYTWGPEGDSGSLKLERVGNVKLSASDAGQPLCLRIRKTGATYHFDWREDPAGAWTEAGTDATADAPIRVGLFARTMSPPDGPLVADFSLFRLAGSGVYLDTSKGRVIARIVDGASAGVSGAWLAVRNAAGHLAGSLATASGADGIAKVFNLGPGTYTVAAVHPWMEPAGPSQTVTVAAGADTPITLALTRLPQLLLDRTGAKAVAPAGWKLLPFALGSAGDDFVTSYLDPAGPAYGHDSDTDPHSKIAWKQDVPVPADLAGKVGIQDNSIAWYRLDLRLPSSWSAYAGRDLLLDGFNVDNADATFWNGHPVGAVTADTPMSWTVLRSYPVPAEDVSFAGPNVLAIQVFDDSGGAGITTNAPTLHVPSAQDGALRLAVADQDGTPVTGAVVALSFFGGAYRVMATTGADPLTFRNLPEGDYLLTIAPAIGLDPVAHQLVTVRRGQVSNLAISVHALPNIVLTSNALDGAQAPAWALLPIPSTAAVQAADDVKPADPAYKDTGRDAAYKVDWYRDVRVPADFGQDTDKRNPIDDNSYFWYRLHLAIPQSWHDDFPDRDLLLTGFNIDDGDRTYFNGTLIGATDGQPDAIRSYAVPRGLVRYGQDNVIAIQGHQITGAAGFTHPDSVPVLAVQSLPPSDAPPPSEGISVPTGTPPVPGDLNGDGKVNVADATLAVRIAVGLLSATSTQLVAGDLNHNGRIDVSDATRILRMAVALP